MPARRAMVFLLAVFLALGPSIGAQRRPGGIMRIVLLVDSSSAVSAMLTQFRAALKDFLDTLPGEPEIVFITTGGQLRIRVPPTSDREKLHEAARSFSPDGGGNSFLETMLEADRRFLKSAADRRPVFVILTTDNGANFGDVRVDRYNRFADDFVSRGGRAHAIVVRSVNSGITTQIAENLVNGTGGFYDVVQIATAVPKLMKTLAEYVGADLH
jgi:hypothetical protein